MQIFKHPHLPFYIISAFLILSIGILIGFAVNPPVEIKEPFNFENSPVFTMTEFEILTSIIIKNLLATFLILSISILGLKFVPAICIGFNGYMLGYTIALLNYDTTLIFATVFPHGYIEFLLLIFTGACSFIVIEELKNTGLNAYTLLTRHGNPEVKYILKNYLFYPYIFIITPGIIITAVIESTISLWNLKTVLGV